MMIRIKNLRLRTLIGIFDWERAHPQDVVINVQMEFDGSHAGLSDKIEDTVDYKKINKNIIRRVEESQFFLLEKLAQMILETVMEDSRVLKAKVEVDKPGALRFADSVSVECECERKK